MNSALPREIIASNGFYRFCGIEQPGNQIRQIEKETGKRQGRERDREKGFRPVWKSKSARERCAGRAGTITGRRVSRNPILYINSRDSRLCVTLPRGPPRLGRREPGESGLRGSLLGSGRGREGGIGRAGARGLERLIRSIEEDRAIGSAGRQRGDLEGSLEMIDTRTV